MRFRRPQSESVSTVPGIRVCPPTQSHVTHAALHMGRGSRGNAILGSFKDRRLRIQRRPLVLGRLGSDIKGNSNKSCLCPTLLFIWLACQREREVGWALRENTRAGGPEGPECAFVRNSGGRRSELLFFCCRYRSPRLLCGMSA